MEKLKIEKPHLECFGFKPLAKQSLACRHYQAELGNEHS
jgi:hypothetical protein